MGTFVGPDLTNENLVYGYDTGYGIANVTTGTRFYPGEPTTNLRSSTQTSGIINGSSGISVAYVAQEDGWSKYSLSGTWSSGTYPYSMSVASQAFTGGTKYSAQLLIRTNVLSKFNTFGTTGFNYVNAALQFGGVNSSTILDDGLGTRLLQRQGFGYVSSTTQPGYLLTNPVSGAVFSSSTDFVWVKNFQIEQKDNNTPHTPTSRSSTQGLIELSDTFDIDLSNMDFDSTAQPTFNGSTSNIQLASTVFNKNGADPFTVECIIKPGRLTGYQTIASNRSATTYNWMLYQHDNGGTIQLHGAAQNKSTYVPVVGNYIHVVATVDSSNNMVLYINGEVKQTVSSFAYYSGQPGTLAQGYYGSSSEPYLGSTSVLKIYDQTLTATQVNSNFNAYKNRFNL
jgi:hypothetical protein